MNFNLGMNLSQQEDDNKNKTVDLSFEGMQN